MIGTAAFALQECVRPDIKQVKSALTATILRLGDVEVRPEEAIELTVKMSKCTAMARPPPMKKFAKRVKPEDVDKDKGLDDSIENEEVDDKHDVYVQLEMQTEYFVPDPNAGDSKEDEDEGKTGVGDDQNERIDRDDLIRGFKYGASYAPCPDGQFPRLETRRGFDLCGFFPDKHVSRFLTIL